MFLEEARRKKDMTQLQMANELGITEKTWRSWEKGERRVSSFVLPKLQEVLGLSDSEVLGIIKTLQREAS